MIQATATDSGSAVPTGWAELQQPTAEEGASAPAFSIPPFDSAALDAPLLPDEMRVDSDADIIDAALGAPSPWRVLPVLVTCGALAGAVAALFLA